MRQLTCPEETEQAQKAEEQEEARGKEAVGAARVQAPGEIASVRNAEKRPPIKPEFPVSKRSALSAEQR
jgi:hypothetical protein